MQLDARLKEELNRRESDNSLRELSLPKNLIDFYSNDYLGLSRNKELFNEIHHESLKYPSIGATGSRLLSGNSELYIEIERFLSEIFNSDTSLVLNSGYSANMAILSSVPKKDDLIIYDELAHACIKDGARLSHAKRFSFKHNNLEDLEAKLKKPCLGCKLVVVESVYSMDGDQCDLKNIVALSEKYNAEIILDEAHTTGLIGPNGGGHSVSLGLEDKIFARIYTFGKAMGCHGAAIACSKNLKAYLVNFARPFIYTTALPIHSLITIKKAFQYLINNISVQGLSNEKVSIFTSLFKEKINNYKIIESNHPIQSIIVPGNDAAKALARKIVENGFEVRPILFPTVRKGTERLRICIHTYNSDNEISSLIDTLAR